MIKRKKARKEEGYNPRIAAPSAPELCTHSCALNLQPALYCHFVLFGQEVPNFSCSQVVHHRLVALLYGKHPRDSHMLSSSCLPAYRLSDSLPKWFLLDSSLAAVVEEMFLHLGCCPASPTAPPAFIVLSMANQIYAVPVSAWPDLSW